MTNEHLTIERYAQALCDRERILDQWEIRYSSGFLGIGAGIRGNTEMALDFLESYAKRDGLDFVPGDIDRSCRSARMDQWLQQNPAAMAQFRKAYAFALTCKALNLSVHMPLSRQAEARARQFEQDELYQSNVFLPIKRHTPGLINKVENAQTDQLVTANEQIEAGLVDEDPVFFPGGPIERLSQLVSLQHAAQRGDLPGELARRGLGFEAFGQAMHHWAQISSGNPQLQMLYARKLSGGSPTMASVG